MYLHHRAQTIIAAGVIVIAGLSAPRNAASAPSRPVLVSIRKDASEQDALAELHQRSGRLILAECPQLEHRSPTDLTYSDLDRAITSVTMTYHLHVMKSASSLIFVRRFWDPLEPLDLPMEEISSIIGGLDSLLSPLAPHYVGRQRDYVRRDFYRSLTPQQLELAKSGMLGFRALSLPQKQTWKMLCQEQAYGNAAAELHGFSEMFRNWKSVAASWDPGTARKLPVMHAIFSWPAAGCPDGRYGDSAFTYNPRFIPGHGAPPAESVEEVPLLHSPIKSCTRLWADRDQPVRLADIATSMSETNGVSVSVPDWAKDRKYILYGAGHTCDEVLRAIATMNGWVIRTNKRGDCVLDRPRPIPTHDALDCFRQIRMLVPPMIRVLAVPDDGVVDRQLARGEQPGIYRADLDRPALAFRLISLEALKLKGGFQPYMVSELDPGSQHRLANLMFEFRALRFTKDILESPRPRAWLTSMEDGIFQIYDVGGDGNKHSVMFFAPAGVDKNKADRYESWGWILGSGAPLAD